MSANLASVAYIAATILFILSLGGLSNPESSRRGNFYGIVGMTIAVLATVFGPRVTLAGIPYIVGALLVGLLANYTGFLAPKLALFSNIGLMVAILLWRPQGLYPVANR